MVMFIYRADYYGLENETAPGSSQIIIAKHRNGQTGEVNLKFIDRYAKFVNLTADFTNFNSQIPYGGFSEESKDDQANVRIMPSRMNQFGDGEAPF